MSRFRESSRMPVIVFGHNIIFPLEIGSAIYLFYKICKSLENIVPEERTESQSSIHGPFNRAKSPSRKFKKTLSSRRILNFRGKKSKNTHYDK